MKAHSVATTGLISIFSIILSAVIMALGNGLMFAYVPFVLATSALPDWVAGTAVSLIALGGLVGCLITGPLIRRVGHARVFACFAGVIIVAAALIGFGLNASTWLASRTLYGIASSGVFIVMQSWINHASANSWRGNAMALFYMSYIIGLGVGALLMGYLPIEGNFAPMLTAFFAASAILPVGLTRLPNPPPPARVSIDIVRFWRSSPVGLIGILASGGLSMLVQGFTPIYAAQSGLGQKDVGTLMFCMQLGMIFVQYPMGYLSDRIDRRYVLIATCLLTTLAAGIVLQLDFAGFLVAAIIFGLWGGATETVYSVAHAHANDRADPDDYVPLASTLLVAWSASAFVGPAIVTALTPFFGQQLFIHAVVAIAIAYAIFVTVRVRMRGGVEAAEAETFELVSSQVPNASALVNPDLGNPAAEEIKPAGV